MAQAADWDGESGDTARQAVFSTAGDHDKQAERIKAAARALGYSPNVLAKSLRTRKTRVVGIALPDVASSHHAEILSGVVNHLAQFDYCCMILPYANDSSSGPEHVESLISRGAEGFIAIDTVLNCGSQISTVAVGGQSHTAGTTVIQLNQKRAAVLALEFFLSQGHRELLLIKDEGLEIRSSRLVRIVLETAAAHGMQVICGRTASLRNESRIVEESADHPRTIDEFAAVLTLDAATAMTARRALSLTEKSPNVSIVCIDCVVGPNLLAWFKSIFLASSLDREREGQNVSAPLVSMKSKP